MEHESSRTETVNCPPPKKIIRQRHRKRNYFNQIREQMEFYFGDANLSKDRFLMQLIRTDNYVPLDVFLRFNKLKKLTNSIEDIVKALSNSTLLELNNEKTSVCRILPIVENQDADNKTIYVEGLPPSADHDWVKKVFTQISGGVVTYVSLPKFHKTKKIKEFGFIEFENEICVEKCIQAFQKFDGVLNAANVEPDKLASIKTYIKEQAEDKSKSQEDSNAECTEKINETSESESDSVDSASDTTNTATADKDDATADILKTADTQKADNNEEVVEDIITADIKPKKRKRKRKQKHKSRKYQPLNMESDVRELKILQKKEWKRLRNKYLNIQREVIAEMKRKAWEKYGGQNKTGTGTGNIRDRVINNKQSNESKIQSTLASASFLSNPQKYEIIKSPHHMNFYGTGDDAKHDNPPESKRQKLDTISDCEYNVNNNIDDNKRNVSADKPLLFKYECGIIIHIGFLESCVNVKCFKADMKQYEYVKYIDVKEGALEAFVRCDSNKSAHQLCTQLQSAEMNCKIITGEQEKQYWDKILRDREMKLNKTAKIQGKRGREKVKKLTANHIRFGDDDE